jgi:hypothetical protein
VNERIKRQATKSGRAQQGALVATESSAPTLCRSDTTIIEHKRNWTILASCGVRLLGRMVDVCCSFAFIYLLFFLIHIIFNLY